MRLLGLERTHQTAIETVQANFEEKQQSFKVSETISDDSVQTHSIMF
jgi:hypothetical protein